MPPVKTVAPHVCLCVYVLYELGHGGIPQINMRLLRTVHLGLERGAALASRHTGVAQDTGAKCILHGAVGTERSIANQLPGCQQPPRGFC